MLTRQRKYAIAERVAQRLEVVEVDHFFEGVHPCQRFLRARGAVCLDWNVMTHLLIVQLRRPAVGLVGGCSGQPLYDDVTRAEHDGLTVADVENVRFIGGEQQLYLPRLLPSDLSVIAFGPV